MRILFTPYGGGSIAHIVRSLAIADELRERGHEILFTAPTTKKAIIEGAGYEVFGQGHAEVNLNDEDDQSITYFRTHKDAFIDWLSDEVHAAEHFRPDVIVNSPTFFGATAGIKLGIPHVTLINAQWLPEYYGVLGLGYSERRPHMSLLRRLANPIFAKKFAAQYMEDIRGFYRAIGVEQLPSSRRDLHDANPALVPSIPEFEPVRRGSRENIHFVGPLFWNGLEHLQFDPHTLFPEFEEKPLVYLTLGGSIYRKESYDQLIQAFQARTDWNVLMSLGPNFARELFPEDSDTFKIRSFVPGLKVCEFADVVVNTASHGTVMQALWHGTPLVTLPHNIDQATIAARITELGVGINLNKLGLKDFTNREAYFERATQIPVTAVLEGVNEALTNPAYQQGARRMQKKLHAYDDAHHTAANWVEHYGGKKLR